MPTLNAYNARSRVVTTNTALHTGSGRVIAYLVSSTSAGTVTLYDNTAASGTKIHEANADTRPFYVRFVSPNDANLAIPFTTGLYAVVPAGTTLNIWYDVFT